jgi:hypothetical protein
VKKTPAAFREQLAKIGNKVLVGDLDRVRARDQLLNWIKRNDRPLADSIIRDFGADRLSDYLRHQAVMLADAHKHDPAEQLALDIFGDVPLRIEIGIGRFADLVDCRRPQIKAAIRQADVKADNAAGYRQRMHDLGARLLPLLPDDETTVRQALRQQPGQGRRAAS